MLLNFCTSRILQEKCSNLRHTMHALANSAAPLIFLSAGEASGEHYGAELIQAIRQSFPGAACFGLGGARMVALGFRAVVRAEDVAHMGITEVVRHAPHIYGQFQRLKRAIVAERPALAVLIDFPDVNLRLAEHLHRQGVPVVFFVSPQLWAWKKWRIRRVQRFVDRMLVIFPFEEPFYRERGVSAEFVGHPLADLPAPATSREAFARQHGLDASKPWVALLPGSRPREVDLNLGTMLEAMTDLGDRYEYILPVAPTIDRKKLAWPIAMRNAWAAWAKTASPGSSSGSRPRIDAMPRVAVEHYVGLPPPVLVDDARAALFHARASIVASGTATVEAALLGNPFVVVYRLSRLSYKIAQRFVSVPHVAMANLIAGRRVVPELIQDKFTAANVVRELIPLLAEGPRRAETIAGLREVRDRLHIAGRAGETAIERAARIALGLIANSADPTPAAGIPSKATGKGVSSAVPAGTYQQ